MPSCLGYFLYKTITRNSRSSLRIYITTLLACVIAIETGAALVPIEAVLSGVLAVPFSTFLVTMLGVHLLVGLVEGLVTVAVLGYLQQVRPDIVLDALPGRARLSKKAVLVTLFVFTVVISTGLSLFACGFPDGLEWSYAERPDQPDFKSAVENPDPRIAAVDDFQSKYSPMPDYSVRASKLGQTPAQQIEASAGWTSFAGVLGAALTMALIWLTAKILRKKETAQS